MGLLLTLSLATIWFGSLIPTALCECYHPDGVLEPVKDFVSCPNAPTICCGLNRINFPGGDPADGDTRDECMPNGLCQNRRTINGTKAVSWWRDSCTDQDWTSGNCLNVCTTGADANIKMTPCDGTATSKKWCCSDNTNCCDTEYYVTLNATFKASGPPISSSIPSSISATAGSQTYSTPTGESTASSSSTSNAPTPAPASATTTSAASGSDKGGLSTGAKAGIGIGAVSGALLFLGLGIVLAKAPWKKRSVPPTYEKDVIREYRASPLAEMAAQPSELESGSPHTAELESPTHGQKIHGRV